LIGIPRPCASLVAAVTAAALTATVLVGCDAGDTKVIGADFCALPPAPPPVSLQVDAFYKKYLDADGIPVLSSGAVDDAAVVSACLIAVHMLSARDDVRRMLIQQGQSIAVIGVNEVTTDIPEYRNLNALYPLQDWDRLRGVGATLPIPVSSVGEENMLCLPSGDIFAGEHLLVQTFATAVLLGVEAVDRTFKSRLIDAYSTATGAGLWANTYAHENEIEYYAEGVQSWFDANPDVAQADGTNGPINTRAELQSYDPTLYALIGETMRADDWRPTCP
jgi:hypothetical protein